MLAWPRPTSSHSDLLDGLPGSHGPVVTGEPHCCMSQSREQAMLDTCYREESMLVMGLMMCEPLTRCVYE